MWDRYTADFPGGSCLVLHSPQTISTLAESTQIQGETFTLHKKEQSFEILSKTSVFFWEIIQNAQFVLPSDQIGLLSCSALSAPKDSTFEEFSPTWKGAAHEQRQGITWLSNIFCLLWQTALLPNSGLSIPKYSMSSVTSNIKEKPRERWHRYLICFKRKPPSLVLIS